MCLLLATFAIMRTTTAVGVARTIRLVGVFVYAQRFTLSTSTIDNQLLAEDLCAGRLLDPGQLLFRQAGHLFALQAQEMDVVATALARAGAMASKTPNAVDTLNTM